MEPAIKRGAAPPASFPRARPRVALTALVFAVGLTGAGSVMQGPGPVFVRVEDRARSAKRDRVVVRDTRTGADREIYRSEGHIPDEADVSPDGRYGSFVEFVGTEGRPSEKRLVTIDLGGQVIRRIEGTANRGIRRYAWCCGSERIAVLRGSTREDTAFRPETVSVVDVRTGAEQPLTGIWRPFQMQWASFD